MASFPRRILHAYILAVDLHSTVKCLECLDTNFVGLVSYSKTSPHDQKHITPYMLCLNVLYIIKFHNVNTSQSRIIMLLTLSVKQELTCENVCGTIHRKQTHSM